MQIHQIKKSKGLKDKARRRGRGNGTGSGNYSGRGLKGQNSRSGSSTRPFFEGGQTSIVQRIPKARGFTRYYKLVQDIVIVNLGHLDADVRIADTMEITKQLLKDLGYIKNATDFVKVLGNGNYAKKLKFVDMDAFSATAKAKIDKPDTTGSASRTSFKDKKGDKKIPTVKKSTGKKVSTPKPAVAKPEAKAPVKVKAVELLETPAKKEKAPVAKKPVVKKPVEKKAPAAKKPAAKKTSK